MGSSSAPSRPRPTASAIALGRVTSVLDPDRLGRVEMVGEPRSVRQAVLLLLTTRRGERVMRPGYGCDLHKLIFSPNDETTAGLAIHYVRKALETWEPRIDILRLDAGASNEAPERLEIHLEYRVRVTRRVESLVFPLNLGGA